MARITVTPATALVDELVKVVITGLNAGQKVTVEAFVEEDNKRFASVAHFEADEEGTVDVSHDPSHGGSYEGDNNRP